MKIAKMVFINSQEDAEVLFKEGKIDLKELLQLANQFDKKGGYLLKPTGEIQFISKLKFGNSIKQSEAQPELLLTAKVEA